MTAPDGTLLSPRWRLAVLAVGAFVAAWSLQAFVNAILIDDPKAYLGDTGTLGSEGMSDAPVVEALGIVTVLLMAGLAVASAVALFLRYRRSHGEQRQQVKWVISGCAVAFALQFADLWEAQREPWGLLQDFIPMASFLALAAGFGFALFRYRLWDIDVVIQRSLIYGTLWLVIAGLYFGVALALGLAASSRVPVWSAVGLTVLASFLFQPARHRLERLADRWVFGRRQEPLKVVYGFGETLGSADQPDDIAGQLARAAAAAAPLTWIKVEVDGSPAVEIGHRRGDPPVEIGLAYAGEPLGRVLCQPTLGSKLTDEELSTLAALAAQAALAISRAQLASRIVRAQETERRRIERNIHDGAQQELVALVAKLGLARSRNGDLDHAGFLAELQGEVRTILGNLRELAQGVHPSVLTDGGLAVAIEDRCSHLAIPVSLDIGPGLRTRRFAEDIEAAAYFVVVEGLTNLLRHSGASSARVSLHIDGGRLVVSVADDGAGFERNAARRGGGLQGLADRFQALGGELNVATAPGHGTTLTASLPIRVATPA
jgi:signal transduction histidine kinase